VTASPPASADTRPDIRVCTSFEEAGVDGPTWNELASRSDTNTVFQTFEWITSWWKVFGNGRQLLLIVARLDDRLVGLAPLMIDRTPRGASTIRFISDSNADYCDFLIAEPRLPTLRAMVDALATRREQWRSLCLINIPRQSFTCQRLPPLCQEHQLMLLVRGHVDCPALVFSDTETQASEIARKHSLKRPYNYFRAQGTVIFEELVSPAAAHANLAHFFEQHVQRWQDSGHPSLFANPSNRKFYTALLDSMLPTGWLVLSRLTLDDQPLAYHFGFHYGKRYYWYKPSFDPRHRNHSPGNLLLRFLLLRALERQCQEFDFTIGNEEFKRRYSNTQRRNINLEIFPRRPAFLLARARHYARNGLRRLVFWKS
jgi:CelD/BcsL family acetyltransferase involved in cellulose biosynthesis